jgi:hypothetical protein
MKTFNLKTIANGAIIQSNISLLYKGDIVLFEYKDDQIGFSSNDSFPFFALAKIRLELEKNGKYILCNGSRVDVFPSGMTVSGLMAYELVLGRPATKLVNILEEFTDINFITCVEAQKQHRMLWLKSIKS